MPKKIKAVEVEFLFNSVSNQKVYGSSPPIPRVVLTPRSSEALLKCGIDPEELRIRDLDSFWEPGIDPKIQRLRHEDYSLRRRDLMQDVRTARAQIEKEHELSRKSKLPSPKAQDGEIFAMVSSMESKEDGGIQSLVEQEEARLKKIQLKKKQEIEQMLAFEMRQIELQEETQAKLQAEELKKKRLKKEEDRRRKEQTETKRMKDLQRQAILEFEEKQRRRLAEEAFRREKDLAEKRKEEELERQREALRKQEERKNKAQAQKEKTEELLKKKQRELDARREQAEAKERERVQKLEEQKAEQAKEIEERRRRVQQRIDMNRKLLCEVEEKKAMDIELKTLQAEERSQRLEEARQEELREKHITLQSMEERRMRAFGEAKREEAMKVQDLLSRQEQIEDSLKRIQENKERNLSIQREQQRLKIESKLRNAERMKRKKEYNQMMLMQKLEDDAARIDSMVEKKNLITMKRKQAAIDAKIKRDTISDAMEKIRLFKKWDEADKLLDKLQDDGPGNRGKGKKKGKKTTNAPSIQKMEGTQSAADLMTPYEQKKAAEAIAIRTAKKLENYNINAAKNAGTQYVSPYEKEVEQHRLEQEKAIKAAKRTTVIPAFASVSSDDGGITF